MGNAFILHGWVKASLFWHPMLMRSLFGVILRLISYNSFEVFSFQESLMIGASLPFYRILRLLVGIIGIVLVQPGFIDSYVESLILITIIYLAHRFYSNYKYRISCHLLYLIIHIQLHMITSCLHFHWLFDKYYNIATNFTIMGIHKLKF